MSATPGQWAYLERDRFSSYRQLSIKGKRVRAWTLYCMFMQEEEPMTPDQIAAEYNVPVAAVREAIAYCQSQPTDLELDFLYEQMWAEATGVNDPNFNGKPKLLSPQERVELDRAFAVKEQEILARASAMTATWVYLAPNPKSFYRQLFVKGMRIRARTLYGLSVGEDALTPEEIAAEYNLPLAAVNEAIAYCESKPPEIEQDFQREEALMEATGMNAPDYKYHGKPKILSAQEMARIRNL